MTAKYQTEIVSETSEIAIKDGRMFRAYTHFNLAPLGSRQILLRTSIDDLTILHGRFVDTVGSTVEFTLYANPTVTDNGVEETKVFNLNTTSNNTTTAKMWLDPTVSNKGVEVDFAYFSGGNQAHISSGSGSTMEFPRVFPENIFFLAEFINPDNTNTANIIYKLIFEEYSED